MKQSSFNITEIIAGMLSGLVIVIIATAFTALIFKGSLSTYFSIGISCALIGSCVANTLIASFSSFRFGIGRAEPAAAAILAIIFENIANAHLSSAALLPTLLTTFAIASLAAGGVMFLLGFFNLGQTARFLPYPVLGGVITGASWIMAASSFSLMVNTKLTIHSLLQTHNMMQYMTGIGFTLFLLCLPKNNSRPWILPVSLLITSIVVNLLLHTNHISHAAAVQMGWLFPSFKPQLILELANFSMIQQVSWITITDQLSYIASLIGLLIILLLLAVSALESITKEKVDLERELKVTGIANLLNGLMTSIPANLSLSGTLLHISSGATQRVSGIIATFVCLIILFIYPNIISYLPKPIISGLILYIAVRLLIEWLYEGWQKLPLIDYLIVLSILITVMIRGFLSGIAIGIIITCIVFIIRSARINAIKYETTGETHHSNVIRPLSHQEWLIKEGNKTLLFKLQGYLFFGSAKLLVDHVTKLLEDNTHKIAFLIFDFQAVNGVDSSAVFSFIRLQQLTDTSHIKLIFSGCSKKIFSQLDQQGIFNASSVMSFSTLDEGLEWCEDTLLKETLQKPEVSALSIKSSLNELIPDEKQQRIFVNYLEKIEMPSNQELIKQGELVDCIYFIESGEISIFLEDKNNSFRVAKSGAGTIIGEISFYLHTARTATVRTETNCVIYKLTGQSMLKLEKSHPDIALTFHKNVIHVLAKRIIQTNYELKLETL